MGVPAEPTLQLFHPGALVFSSHGRWLHPLLELETFLRNGPPAAECTLRDRVVGRAAALLEVRLGLRVVHAVTLSRLGESVFLRHRVRYTFDALVDRIACRTEELLTESTHPDEAHRIVSERARSAG